MCDSILGVLGLKQSRETALFTTEERVALGRGAGHALTQAGCNRLLRKSAHADARPLLLHLEREAFMSLIGEEKTRERMAFMLQNGKPLRN